MNMHLDELAKEFLVPLPFCNDVPAYVQNGVL